MPEATAPSAGGMPAPVGAAGGGAAPAGQQAPMGVSSVTGPTPNKGYEAQVIQQLANVGNTLQNLIPMVGFNSELGSTIRDLLNKLAKALPAGNQDQQAQRNAMQAQMQKMQQQAQMAQQLKQPAPQSTAQVPGGPPMSRGMAA